MYIKLFFCYFNIFHVRQCNILEPGEKDKIQNPFYPLFCLLIYSFSNHSYPYLVNIYAYYINRIIFHLHISNTSQQISLYHLNYYYTLTFQVDYKNAWLQNSVDFLSKHWNLACYFIFIFVLSSPVNNILKVKRKVISWIHLVTENSKVSN